VETLGSSPPPPPASHCSPLLGQESPADQDVLFSASSSRGSSVSATALTGTSPGQTSESPTTSNDPEISRSVTQQPLAPISLQYVCREHGCSQRFTQRRQLENHRRKHKMFNCDECTASYAHPKNLREHRQSQHQGLRYYCGVDGCGKSMAQKKNLARHKASKHGLPNSS
jgi:hypothetical protein